jgi:hypothetical protein
MQEVKAKLDEKQKKTDKEGPAWWYEPVGSKVIGITVYKGMKE